MYSKLNKEKQLLKQDDEVSVFFNNQKNIKPITFPEHSEKLLGNGDKKICRSFQKKCFEGLKATWKIEVHFNSFCGTIKMNINVLPDEIASKIMLHNSHPVADMIKDWFKDDVTWVSEFVFLRYHGFMPLTKMRVTWKTNSY